MWFWNGFCVTNVTVWSGFCMPNTTPMKEFVTKLPNPAHLPHITSPTQGNTHDHGLLPYA